MNEELEQLQEMRRAAYGLGTDFARLARAEADVALKLQLLNAFQASFQSVRLSIALEDRLRAPARSMPERAERPETERPERPDSAERPDWRVPLERERDRDRETVSLPKLLRTMQRVATDAEALLPQAAELPALRDLLANVAAKPAPRRPQRSPSALRARLSGGAAALTLAPTPKPPAPNLPGLPRHPATGPPRR